MFVHTKNQLCQLPKPLMLRVAECAKVQWSFQGLEVPLREFTESEHSHALVIFEKGECPHALAYGDLAQMEAVFAAIVEAIASGERVFDLDRIYQPESKCGAI